MVKTIRDSKGKIIGCPKGYILTSNNRCKSKKAYQKEMREYGGSPFYV